MVTRLSQLPVKMLQREQRIGRREHEVDFLPVVRAHGPRAVLLPVTHHFQGEPIFAVDPFSFVSHKGLRHDVVLVVEPLKTGSTGANNSKRIGESLGIDGGCGGVVEDRR